MEKVEELFNSLLTVQEKFFEELAVKLKKDFYYLKKIYVSKAEVSFDLDRHYSIRFEGVNLVLYDGDSNYDIKNLSELYIYLNIRSSAIREEDNDE